jgi:hypothetical protein
VVGNFVGLGDGIKDGVGEGFRVVGSFVGVGVGKVDGTALGDGEGICEGL